MGADYPIDLLFISFANLFGVSDVRLGISPRFSGIDIHEFVFSSTGTRSLVIGNCLFLLSAR